MTETGSAFEIWDNGGRRSGVNRRYYSYSGHIPERRNGMDRRTGEDRRSGEDRRQKPRIIDFNTGQKNLDRRKAWNLLYM